MRLRVYSALALVLAGCLDHELAPDAEGEPGSSPGAVFIAQQRDFVDFEDWTPFEIEVSAEHTGVKGTITEYLSEMPAPNSDSFPVGTMIAKTVETDKGMAPEIHAMAKRGGTFNTKGAQGWEFFELKKDEDGTPVIVWRGAKPPDGERYKNLLDPNATAMESDCNSCHADGNNDAVLSDELSLRLLP